MTQWADDLHRFTVKVDARSKAMFANVASAALGSITDGSPVTGAPGQPVQTGTLKASWRLEFPEPTLAEITTQKVPYATSIEDGVSYAHGGTPMVVRSPVGGFHSVALTIAGFPRLVDAVVAEMGP